MIQLRAYGKIAEVTGWSENMAEGERTVQEWRNWLETNYPALKGYQYAVAVNLLVSAGELSVADGSEVAFLPPFSGG